MEAHESLNHKVTVSYVTEHQYTFMAHPFALHYLHMLPHIRQVMQTLPSTKVAPQVPHHEPLEGGDILFFSVLLTPAEDRSEIETKLYLDKIVDKFSLKRLSQARLMRS